MRRLMITVTLVSLLLIGRVMANEQELFLLVSAEELEKVERENEYFLKKHRYFAEKSKIVRINSDALQKQESIQITLFDGVVVKANRLKVEETPDGGIVWNGVITEPAYSRGEYQPTNTSMEVADFLYESHFALSLFTASYDRERTSGAVFPSGQDYIHPPSATKPQIQRRTFHSLYANISAPTLPSKYRVRDLEMSPEYQIVIMIDEEKQYPPGEIEQPSQGTLDAIQDQLPDNFALPQVDMEEVIQEMKEKRRRHQQFLQELGPDPRLRTDESRETPNQRSTFDG